MRLSVAGRTMIPVKIGTNSQTRLTKYDAGMREAMASRKATAYIPMSTGMLRVIATAITMARTVNALTRGSIICSRPRRAAMSSVNNAWRMTLDAPAMVLSTKLVLLRLPMQPQGHSAVGDCNIQSGVVLTTTSAQWWASRAVECERRF